MRTLHFGVRVADLERSLALYGAVGYEIVGSIPETPLSHLTMLKLPGDEFLSPSSSSTIRANATSPRAASGASSA